jgi:ureidoacrylate peracid hydrolase
MTTPVLTRDLPLRRGISALLVIDVQNFCCHRDGGLFAGRDTVEFNDEFGTYLDRLEANVIPNLQRIIGACRRAGIEVIYTTIEALTADGRDLSLDYKISQLIVPKGAWDGQVIDAIAPETDDIRLPKGASSVFNATNIAGILRNLGVARLAVAGVMTDQCVESAVRDACDHGFLVTLVHDACTALSAERHTNSLKAVAGYCRLTDSDALLRELEASSSIAT